jgi:hypothetical protein
MTTRPPSTPTARAARFREGLGRLQTSPSAEWAPFAAELLLRFKLHSRAMGLKDLWDKTIASMWDEVEGDNVRTDFIAAMLEDAARVQSGKAPSMATALLATAFAIDVLREDDDALTVFASSRRRVAGLAGCSSVMREPAASPGAVGNYCIERNCHVRR